uniref:Uncharacterized protein n=1 Tax=Eutreptiella gymnastica TaxID=73025 RepID=A0A7S4FYK8_9EUGL
MVLLQTNTQLGCTCMHMHLARDQTLQTHDKDISVCISVHTSAQASESRPVSSPVEKLVLKKLQTRLNDTKACQYDNCFYVTIPLATPVLRADFARRGPPPQNE